MRPYAHLIAVMLLMPAAAAAQAPAELADIAAKVRAMGPVIDPPNTAKIYTPFQEKEPYGRVQVLRDLKYGPDERQALDLFAPEPLSGGARPVLIFASGGGYVTNDKRNPTRPAFYDNVMLWAVRHGMIAVNINYRIAPAHPWPAGAEDVGAAVAWAAQNVAPYGGDPRRVFLMGHSTGAVHSASYATHPEFYGPYGLAVAGLILVSGIYEFPAAPMPPPGNAYFGDDPKLYAERSSLAGLLKLRVPIFLAHAELDPPEFQQQHGLLKDALCKEGRCPSLLVLRKHSHMSEIYAINTTDKSLSDPLLQFIKKAE
jgi:triacylglycerol lipase